MGVQLPHKLYSINLVRSWLIMGCARLWHPDDRRSGMPTVAQSMHPYENSAYQGGFPSLLWRSRGKNVDVTLAEMGFEFVEVPQRAMVTHLLDVPVQRWCNPELQLVTVWQRRQPLERLYSFDDKYCILSWPLVRTKSQLEPSLIRTLPSRTLIA